jgi:hypothetical protein
VAVDFTQCDGSGRSSAVESLPRLTRVEPRFTVLPFRFCVGENDARSHWHPARDLDVLILRRPSSPRSSGVATLACVGPRCPPCACMPWWRRAPSRRASRLIRQSSHTQQLVSRMKLLPSWGASCDESRRSQLRLVVSSRCSTRVTRRQRRTTPTTPPPRPGALAPPARPGRWARPAPTGWRGLPGRPVRPDRQALPDRPERRVHPAPLDCPDQPVRLG